jgi:S1-C subfamily serine protease
MDSTVSPNVDQISPVAPTVPWWRRPLAIVGAIVLLVSAVGYGVSRGPSTPKSTVGANEVAKQVDEALKKAASAPARSAQIYRTILPSLVFISTDRTDRTDRTDSADSADRNRSTPESSESTDSTERGSEDSRQRNIPKDPESLGGLGTGVIISAQGAILTAHHVIAGADVIEVTFSDGTKAKANVVSDNPEQDTAVLIADQSPEVIVPAVLAGGGQVGDEVYAVGHPLGLVGSMSGGIISGLGRSVPLDDELTLQGLIQFDAAVNPGNSGGPLLNRNGQVIGIVTALANPTDQNFFVGIGFAVPIETAGAGANGPGTGIQR